MNLIKLITDCQATWKDVPGRWEAIGKKVYCWGGEDVSPPDVETLVMKCDSGVMAEHVAALHNGIRKQLEVALGLLKPHTMVTLRASEVNTFKFAIEAMLTPMADYLEPLK